VRSKLLLRVGISALAAALIAFSPAAAQEKGGTLVTVVDPEPASLNLYMTVAGNVCPVACQVYEGLVSYDYELNPVPALAESWEVSEDGLTVTFKLREGVTFHDGSSFTSADVAYSFMEILKPFHPRGSVVFADLEAVETPDDYTAVFKLSQPAPYMMSALSALDAPIVSAALFEGTDPASNPTANAPIGTGPFKFVDWERGQYIRMDRNENYWAEGKPYLDTVVARFIPDAGTRTAALETGEVHFAGSNTVNTADVARLRENPDLDVTEDGYQMTSVISQIEFNTQRAPFDDQRVRQAIAYAIDRQFIVDNVLYGLGAIATGPLSSNFAPSGLYTDDVRRFDVADRLEIANALLDEAGHPRGEDGVRFAATIDVNPFGEQWVRQGEYLKQALAEVGIDITLRTQDTATWVRRIYTDYDFDMNTVLFANLSDPVIGMHRQFLTSSIQPGVGFVNATRYSNPVVDKLLEEAKVAVDPARRAELYHEVQQIIVEESPNVFLTEIKYVSVSSKRFQNTTSNALGPLAPFTEASLATAN